MKLDFKKSYEEWYASVNKMHKNHSKGANFEKCNEYTQLLGYISIKKRVNSKDRILLYSLL